jgi:hypothetical protein
MRTDNSYESMTVTTTGRPRIATSNATPKAALQRTGQSCIGHLRPDDALVVQQAGGEKTVPDAHTSPF